MYDRDQLSPTNAFSSETENIAIDLATVKDRIERMRTKVKVIETALQGLNQVEYTIISMKYFEGFRWYQVAWEVKYDESWCKEIRKRALRKLATAMFGEMD